MKRETEQPLRDDYASQKLEGAAVHRIHENAVIGAADAGGHPRRMRALAPLLTLAFILGTGGLIWTEAVPGPTARIATEVRADYEYETAHTPYPCHCLITLVIDCF